MPHALPAARPQVEMVDEAYQRTIQMTPEEEQDYHDCINSELGAHMTRSIFKAYLALGHWGSGKKKAKGIDKANNQIDNVLGSLKCLLNDLPKMMTAEMRETLRPKLVEVRKQAQLVEQCIEEQDAESQVLPSPQHRRTTPLPSYSTIFVDTVEGVKDVVDTIAADEANSADSPTTIFVDSEGGPLGRNGTISLLQIFFGTGVQDTVPDDSNTAKKAEGKVWLLDLFTLGERAFCTPGTSARTLRDIFESESIRKVFWDCRADSDALYHLCQVHMSPKSVVDLQLFDFATIEQDPKGKLSSLDKAVKARIHLNAADSGKWYAGKKQGQNVYQLGKNWRAKQYHDREKADEYATAVHGLQSELNPTQPTNYSEINDGWRMEKAWETRPLPKQMVEYAAGDVIVLEPLLKHLENHKRLDEQFRTKIAAETAHRIANSQSDHQVEGSNKGPKGWR